MTDAKTEISSWIRSPWIKWSWLLLLIAIVAHSLNYHWRALPTSAAGYFARAKADYLNGEFESAVANFTRSLALEPNDADSLLWRGEAYVRLRDLARAMPDLERAVELRPKYDKALAAFGTGKAAAWDAPGAIDAFSRAIANEPNYARCYLARGKAFLDTERWNDAADDLRVAAQLLPEDKQGPANLLLWVARARGGDAAGATAELASVVKSRRVAGDLFRTSARFLCGELAESAYLKATAGIADADDGEKMAEAFFLAGEKRLAIGDRVGALELLREVLKHGAESSYAYDRTRVEVERLLLGFHPRWLEETRRNEIALAADTGLLIAAVTAGGPAEAAGVRPGAVLATIDGVEIGQKGFVEFLSKTQLGSAVVLELIDDSGAREIVPLSLRLDFFAPTR